MFYAYAALGLGCAGIYACLPQARMTEKSRVTPLSRSRPAALTSIGSTIDGSSAEENCATV
jgi:hypothetical protein